jgi:FkbM family methyltransferase
MNGIHEATGSIPVSSTKSSIAKNLNLIKERKALKEKTRKTKKAVWLFIKIGLLCTIYFIFFATDLRKHDIAPFFANIKNISAHHQTKFLSKQKVFYNYLKLESLRLLGLTSKNKVSLFGFNIDYMSSQSLRSLISEVFINNDYFVNCKKSNPYIIDLGGNIGITTLYYKTLYPQSEILVFEPSSTLFKKLSNNIQKNSLKNITAVNKAVFSQEGALYFTDNSNLNGQVSTKKTNTPIQTTILSKHINKDVDILKMDIEGAELHVLNDLHITKKIKHIKNIVLEYHHNDFDSNEKLYELLKIFESNNFSYKIKSAHNNDPYMTITASRKNDYSKEIFHD